MNKLEVVKHTDGSYNIILDGVDVGEVGTETLLTQAEAEAEAELVVQQMQIYRSAYHA